MIHVRRQDGIQLAVGPRVTLGEVWLTLLPVGAPKVVFGWADLPLSRASATALLSGSSNSDPVHEY